jgi:hypothetical protein
MAYYLVRARVLTRKTSELKRRLDSGEIYAMKPFGTALDESLKRARIQPDGIWVWEEQDYCVPPLAMERAAVLDQYFEALEAEPVQRGQGWKAIEGLPKAFSGH